MTMQKRNGQVVPVEETIEPYGPIVEGSSRSLPEGNTGDQWSTPQPGYRQERSGEVPPATELRDPPGQTEQKKRRGLGLGKFFRGDSSEKQLVDRLARQSAETYISGIEQDEVDTHYETLSNVDPNTARYIKVTLSSSDQEIYVAYRMARQIHRDDSTKIIAIEEAYRVLSDPKAKQTYDSQLRLSGRDQPRDLETLPRKYQKQFKREAKTQARDEKNVISRANALGISLYRTTTSGGFDIGEGGLAGLYGSRNKRPSSVPRDTTAGKRKKTISELRLEIAEYENKLGQVSSGVVTGSAGTRSPAISKTQLTNTSDSTAGKFLRKVGSVQKKAGKTPLGKRISAGQTGETTRKLKAGTKGQVGANLFQQTMGSASKLRVTEKKVGNMPYTTKQRRAF